MKKRLLTYLILLLSLQLTAQEIELKTINWEKGGMTLKVPKDLEVISDTEEEYQMESDDIYFLIGRVLNGQVTYRELVKSFWGMMSESGGEVLSEFSSSTNGVDNYHIIGKFSIEGEIALVYVIGIKNPDISKDDYLINFMLRDVYSPTEESDKAIDEILQSIEFN